MKCTTRSTPRSAPHTQRDFDAGGLRYAQNIINLDASREFAVGFAKPLTFAAGAEYRHEQFGERPGDLQSWAIGPYFRSAISGTTLANCNTQGGVFNAGTNVCTFPGRAAPAGAQGFPGIPDSSRTDETATATHPMPSSTPSLSRG